MRIGGAQAPASPSGLRWPPAAGRRLPRVDGSVPVHRSYRADAPRGHRWAGDWQGRQGRDQSGAGWLKGASGEEGSRQACSGNSPWGQKAPGRRGSPRCGSLRRPWESAPRPVRCGPQWNPDAHLFGSLPATPSSAHLLPGTLAPPKKPKLYVPACPRAQVPSFLIRETEATVPAARRPREREHVGKPGADAAEHAAADHRGRASRNASRSLPLVIGFSCANFITVKIGPACPGRGV